MKQNVGAASRSIHIWVLRILLLALFIYVQYLSTVHNTSYASYINEIWGGQDLNIDTSVTNTNASLYTDDLLNRTNRKRTLHVIQCLSGNATDFIDEWEINLKSVLMNAPIDSKLHVHVIADDKAYSAVKERLGLSELASSLWRNELTITVSNVESRVQEWRNTLKSILSGGSPSDTQMKVQEQTKQRQSVWFDAKIGMGGYFRLFAYKVILEYTDKQNDLDLHCALYMDTDVVVITNLNHFQRSMDKIQFNYRQNPEIQQVGDASLEKDYPLITWRDNSGFMAMDVPNLDRFWNGLNSLSFLKSTTGKTSDQVLISIYQSHFPRDVATLPDEWFVHIGHGYRRSPQQLFDHNIKAGFLHFTGYDSSYFSPPGIIKFCQRGKGCNQEDVAPGGDVDKFDRTWGRAGHYTKLTWTWVRYQGGESRIAQGEEGYEARVEFRAL